MKLIDHLNIYFGTEYKNVAEFIRDIKKGDLSDEYENADEKLNQVLLFLNSLSKNI